MTSLDLLQQRAGVRFFDYQSEALARAATQQEPQRLCLYYKTGAGKSITALAALAQWGHDAAVVVTPPSTFPQWERLAVQLGIEVTCMSHAKFRMKDTKLSRSVPIIADEMHMFGGHKGQGWKKLEAFSRGLRAPLVLASATPNYNDAERVYCIQRILDPLSCKGGFIEFLYRHCETEQNPFAREPIVTGFRNFKNAAEYLASLEKVEYLPDDLLYTIQDVPYQERVPVELMEFGYNRRRQRMIASGMEERHTIRYQGLVNPNGFLWPHVWRELRRIGLDKEPTIVYCNHATVAEALAETMRIHDLPNLILTGDTSKKQKAEILRLFLSRAWPTLIGTASLATGTDGLDKMCDRLIILDDTDDDSLRRQLIGRIMPRGSDTDASRKRVYRLLPE